MYNILILSLTPITVVPLVTPTNSPRIGPRSEAYISIPESAANGYISFSQSSLTAFEPEDGGFGSLSLTLTRTGAYGTATITWMVVSITTDSNDLGTSSGITLIENGSRHLLQILFYLPLYTLMPVSVESTQTSVSNQIVVVILNDDEPEIDETFEVQLVSVEESGQRINPEQVRKLPSLLGHTDQPVYLYNSSSTEYISGDYSSQRQCQGSVHRLLCPIFLHHRRVPR